MILEEAFKSVSTQRVKEIYDEGISILITHMGTERAEEFISLLSLSANDYTKWHQKMADSMTQEEFDRIVEEAERTSPYTGDPSTIL